MGDYLTQCPIFAMSFFLKIGLDIITKKRGEMNLSIDEEMKNRILYKLYF